MGVYSSWGSSLLNVMVQFFLMNYLLYDFIFTGILPSSRHKSDIVQGGREVTGHPDNTHLRLNISLHSTAQHTVQCKMLVWQQCAR